MNEKSNPAWRGMDEGLFPPCGVFFCPDFCLDMSHYWALTVCGESGIFHMDSASSDSSFQQFNLKNSTPT
jgi:hypothetical protein